MLDPNASRQAKDEALQRLDSLEGTTAPDDPVSGRTEHDAPPEYDGQKAAARVVQAGRHAGI